jgi:pilus assembly protein CpaD
MNVALAPGKQTMRRTIPYLLSGLTFLLAGCQYDAVLEDNYKPATYQERFPIKVANGTARTGIRAPQGVLNTEQTNAISNFVIEAKRYASSKVQIRYPSGSGPARVLATNIATSMMNQGLPKSRIWVGSYRGGASAPIELVLNRKIAISKECGDWSDLADTYGNRPYSDFGCATQHNLAALVANPEDLERPREMGPVLAANRTETMKIFVENGTTGDYWTFDVDGQTAKSP